MMAKIKTNLNRCWNLNHFFCVCGWTQNGSSLCFTSSNDYLNLYFFGNLKCFVLLHFTVTQSSGLLWYKHIIPRLLF